MCCLTWWSHYITPNDLARFKNIWGDDYTYNIYVQTTDPLLIPFLLCNLQKNKSTPPVQSLSGTSTPTGKDQGALIILVECLGRGILRLRLRLRHRDIYRWILKLDRGLLSDYLTGRPVSTDRSGLEMAGKML